jgi:hypothetical protein
MKKSEFFSCSLYLADWPDGCSFHDVLVGVMDRNPDFLVDVNFRSWDRDALALEIEYTEKKFRRAVADLLNPDKTPADELETYKLPKKPQPPKLNQYFQDVSAQLAALTIIK